LLKDLYAMLLTRLSLDLVYYLVRDVPKNWKMITHLCANRGASTEALILQMNVSMNEYEYEYECEYEYW